MYCVYVPTNHLYIGDIFLVSSSDVIRPNMSVREGIGMPIWVLFLFSVIFIYSDKYALNHFDIKHHLIAEIVVSVGTTMPQVLSILETEPNQLNRIRSTRS
jgi:hypothetical protein